MHNSDLIVSRLCVGGCPMGGYGWGTVSETDMIDAVQAAISQGVNMFDTADTYGLGQSERLLGTALGANRKSVIIATKVGVRVENGKTFYDNSREWINKAVESSLRRLNTDYIDIYQIHYRDKVTPLSDVIETFEKLKIEGKIRYFGLSNIYKDDMAEISPYADSFVSFQDEYSLACRTHEVDILHLIENFHLTPLTWGSLGQGILTGKYDANCLFGKDDRRSREVYTNFHGDKLVKNLKIVEVLKEISNEVKKSVASVAIRFILDFIPRSVVLAGVKNKNQVISNCEAFGWKLTPGQINRLKAISE